MKRVVVATALAVLLAFTGCVAGSHIELGPLRASSWVQAHEWREADFYAREGVVGSTFGFLSSEVAVAVGECEGLSVGASLNWGVEEEE